MKRAFTTKPEEAIPFYLCYGRYNLVVSPGMVAHMTMETISSLAAGVRAVALLR